MTEAPQSYSKPFRERPNAEWVRHVRERTLAVISRAAPSVALDALELAGKGAEMKRARVCGRIWGEFEEKFQYPDESTGSLYSLRQLRCHSRYCPACHRAWEAQQIEKIEAFESLNGQKAYTVLMTFTAGKTVTKVCLNQRLQVLKASWRLLRRRLKKHGLVGGFVSYEVVFNDGLYHVHLHVYARFSCEARWLKKDTSYILNKQRKTWEMTPAWLFLMRAWGECLAREDPQGYEKLPLLRNIWTPRMYAAAAKICKNQGFDMPERFISCDIGGRKPGSPGKNSHDEGFWKPLELVTANPKECLKYAAKAITPAPGSLWGNDPYMLAQVIRLFSGKRRVQSFGDLYGKRPEFIEIEDETEATEEKELLTEESGFTSRYCSFVLPGDDGETINDITDGVHATEKWRAMKNVSPGYEPEVVVDKIKGLLYWFSWSIHSKKRGKNVRAY